MKKYFLHNGTESSGPFDFEELKAKRITPKTPVWFDGMEKWKTAEAIPELNSLFTVTPPPFSSSIEKPKQQNITHKTPKKQILGMSKNTFLVVLGILILAIITVVFNTLDEERKRELDQKNHKTEVENYQLELKEKEIEEQKKLVAQAEKAAAERALEAKKQTYSDRVVEIEKLIAICQSNLETTKNKLNKASGFKILRSSAEKKQELYVLQRQIDSIATEIDQLKIESNQLKLEMEKIPE